MNGLNGNREKLDDFILFLENNKFDSGNVEIFIKKLEISRFIKKIFGFLLIILALAIIIIPLPNGFEMATLFYFNRDDGFTLSDLIALFILFAGIILVIKDKIYYGSFLDR